ncbi:Hint domain-containing protein [Maritimibacter dapengensis]|uniref:Hint domain-containing protein n=1 Tax=Maritimibacter dapengensis TaxID=2836868 RepID=A0ABS6SZG6_9RHOB|nr:Hint domain-containing protein [Maritimibacter dapengensis]MBV7377913.1 Hint domain-containing protein [Maritimibacter dapengensis]
MAERSGYLITPNAGGGYDVGGTEFVFDELDYQPVSSGTINYPTTFGLIHGVAYDVGGIYYFVPDDPLPAAPSEAASIVDIDFPLHGNAWDETISAPDGDGHILYSGPSTSGTGSGSDTIIGGAGADHIFVGDGDDAVMAGEGDDIIGGWTAGTSGDNTLSGEGGDDQIIGGTGNDTIHGGDGDDTLSGSAGSDTLHGEEGSDLFLVTDDHQRTDVHGGDTGTDFDEIAFATYLSSSPVVVTFSGDGDGHYSFTQTDGFGDFTGVEAIYGTGFDDLLNASLSQVGRELRGGAGDDYIQGGSGGDALYGGAGNDTLIGGGQVVSGANLIENGSFEDVSGMTAQTYGFRGDGSAPGWTETSGFDVDFHGDGRNGIDATDGSYWLDMEGNGGENLSIWQDVGGIVEGDTYLLRFDVADFASVDDNSALDNRVEVVWNGQRIALVDPPDGDWDTFEFVLTGGDGSNRIEFRGSGAADAAGASIDNVRLFAVQPTSDGNDVLDGGDGDDVILAGGGTDTITGGAGDDTFAFKDGDGTNVITDFDMGDDDADGFTNDQLDFSGLTDPDGETVETWDMDVTDDGSGNALLTFDDGTTVTLMGVAPAALNGGTLYSMGVPCFVSGTRIATPHGEVRVEDLRPGDQVCGADGAVVEVIWCGSSTLGPEALAVREDLRPICLRPGTLGNRYELRVSPQHRIVLPEKDGRPAGLIPARWLAEEGDGRFRVALGMARVTYYHLLLTRHAVLLSDGALSESFYPGPQALIALDRVARRALFDVLPDLARIVTDEDVLTYYGPLALPELDRATAKRLIATLSRPVAA